MNTDKITHLRPKRDCPQCGQPSTQKAYPFCSKRCSDLDLGNWLNGNYTIAARSNDEDDYSSSYDDDPHSGGAE